MKMLTAEELKRNISQEIAAGNVRYKKITDKELFKPDDCVKPLSEIKSQRDIIKLAKADKDFKIFIDKCKN